MHTHTNVHVHVDVHVNAHAQRCLHIAPSVHTGAVADQAHLDLMVCKCVARC